VGFQIKDFIDFIKITILKFPVNFEQLKENPLPPFIAILLLYFLIKGKFKKFFNILLIILIFMFGYFYGILQPFDNQTISIAIFAFSALISLVLLIFNFFVKDE